MANLRSSGIRGHLVSAKATGKKILDKFGQLVPEIVDDFVSGFAGHGWKIWKNNGRHKLEIDDIVVRNTLTVFELLISKIRALKGAMAITQANGKAKSVREDDVNYYIAIEDEMSFVPNDIVRCLEFNAGQRAYWVIISAVQGDEIVIPKSEFVGYSIPQEGDDIVQFGNTTDVTRQSAIYLHADENGQPAIDVMFGINKKSFDGCIKIRVGGDIPGGNGLKGFYCENGMIKGVDSTGHTVYCIYPDGTAEFGDGSASFKPDKSGHLAGGAISWLWDAAKGKYVCTLGDVVIKWENLDDETKENLKGDPGASYVNVYMTSAIQPETPTGTTIPPTGWSTVPTQVTETEFLWMSQLRINSNGTMTPWSEPIRLSGLNGKPGEDGTDVEFVYKQTDTNATPSTPSTSQADDYVPTGWTDNPSGVSPLLPYEWISVRYKKAGEWTPFSAPVVWSKWGRDGRDGDGFEYVFKLTTIHLQPDTPPTDQADDYVPTGWTDDPTGISAQYPYEWVSTRKKKDGVWSYFSTPALWAKYGKDGLNGEDGLPGPPGADGRTSYFHIKYSDNPDGNPMSENPGVYIGTYVDFTKEDSSDYRDYKWARFEGIQGPTGEQGIPGINGENGQTSYLHIKYSNDGGITFTGNNGEDVGSYIGIYVDFNIDDSTNPDAYKWSKIKGEDGKDANLLPWVEDWDNNKTQIGDTYLISPRIFSGVNRGTAAAPVLTGVAIGFNVIKDKDGNLKSGVFGIKDSEIMSSIDSDTGQLTAKGATIEGNIKAIAGKIGKFSIDDGILKGGERNSNSVEIDSLGLELYSGGYLRAAFGNYLIDKILYKIGYSVYARNDAAEINSIPIIKQGAALFERLASDDKLISVVACRGDYALDVKGAVKYEGREISTSTELKRTDKDIFVTATSDINIKLPFNPEQGQEIRIRKCRGGNINILGNGKDILAGWGGTTTQVQIDNAKLAIFILTPMGYWTFNTLNN